MDFTGIVPELLKLGWPGIVVALLIYVIKVQRKDFSDLVDKFDKMQERRAEERAQNTAVLAASAQAQNKLADSSAALRETIQELVTLVGEKWRRR